MTRSFNQIERMASKATRGSGLPWGVADEAGKAVARLHRHGLNGARILAETLYHHSHHATQSRSPVLLSGVWRASSGVLDPVLVGGALGDCLERLTRERIETATIAYPLLVAGFLADIAACEDRAFTLAWHQVRLYCRRDCLRIQGAMQAVECEVAEWMYCELNCGDSVGSTSMPQLARATVDPGIWKRLEQYAQQTYIASTADTHMTGAGAGLIDND